MDYMDDPSELPLDEAWRMIEEKAGSQPKSKGKGAEIDLPPAPKRSISAYLHFCAEKRPEVSATVKSLGSISKELARLWRETSEEERKPFDELAKSGKLAYEEAKKKWTAECQKVLKKEASASGVKPSRVSKAGVKPSRVSKATKGSSGPKRPLSAYIYFCGNERAEVSKKFDSLGEISKELSRRWALASPVDREPYAEMAAKDKERYEREKVDGVSLEQPVKKNGRKSPAKKKTSTKKKRGPSAYMLFCAEHRGEIVDENDNKLPLGETTKRLAKMWHECSDDARAKFTAEAAKQKSLI
jgi:polyhydroxyalkanoate synthesis regulator phasin